ncbi:MAG: flagellar assembly protein FliH, partial [Cellulomonas sp.]|jgi:flagellar assembly protein FliH|nr:flagellar assembly protein FliH [Cellulomonas sp.]
MSSSSDAFQPLAARRVADTTGLPTQRAARGRARLDTVPAQREQGGVATAEVRPAFAAPVEIAARTAAATGEAVPARFVPLVEPADQIVGALATHEQARAAGFAAGFAAGSREAAKVAAAEAEAAYQRAEAAEAARADEHAQAMAALAAAVRAVGAARVPVLDAAQDRLHAAALELARAVLGVELSDAPTAARAVLARAANAGVSSEVVVRMNPRDADAVVAPEGMRVVVDPTLAHGDAVVEHGEGELDARIDSALERARAVLVEAMTTSQDEGLEACEPSGLVWGDPR